MNDAKLILVLKGPVVGRGRGNWGHAGRPGIGRGGSGKGAPAAMGWQHSARIGRQQALARQQRVQGIKQAVKTAPKAIAMAPIKGAVAVAKVPVVAAKVAVAGAKVAGKGAVLGARVAARAPAVIGHQAVVQTMGRPGFHESLTKFNEWSEGSGEHVLHRIELVAGLGEAIKLLWDKISGGE